MYSSLMTLMVGVVTLTRVNLIAQWTVFNLSIEFGMRGRIAE